MSQFYKITLGTNSKVVEGGDKAMEVAGEMVAAVGSGVPSIVPCDEHGHVVEKEEEATKVETDSKPITSHTTVNQPSANKSYSTWGNTIIDEEAKKRIEKQHASLEASGIKVDTSQQFFATGTRMAKIGYSTQQARQDRFYQQKLLVDAINELKEKTSGEIRRDYVMSAKEVANLIEVEDDEVFLKDHLLTEQAINGLTLRLESPARSYLLGLRERIINAKQGTGAFNPYITQDVNKFAEVLRYECLRYPDVQCKFRMREFPNDIYTVVSPTYPPADASMVMEQVLDQMPRDARGSYEYNPDTTAWSLRAEVFTPTPVEEQSVGEAFSAFCLLSSRDDGTGRFRGGGGINLLRCLNASTYSAGETMSRVHRGKIMLDINSMVKKSLTAMHALCEAWGKAREEIIEVPVGLTLEQAFPGLILNLLTDKNSDLFGILPGRKANHAKALTETYFDQRRDLNRLVKADVAQAWTRYIQNQPFEVRTEGELAAGNFIVNKQKFQFVNE